MKQPGEPKGVYKALTISRIDLVDRGASFDPETGTGAHVLIAKRDDTPWAVDVSKSVLSAATRNKLPNSSFAVVDANGVGHLPYKHADGSIDLPHLRNALARLNQTQLSPADKAKAKAKLEAAARAHLPSHEATKMADTDYEDGEDKMDEDETKPKGKKAPAKKSDPDVEAIVTKAVAAEVTKREALEAEVRKLRDERERETYVAKAEKLPTFGEKTALGEILHACAKALTKEQYAHLVGKMEAAHTAITTSKLMAEVGGNETSSGDTDSPITKIAFEIRKSNPKLTTEQAYAEALNTPEGRAWYADVRTAAERGA
jgi:hypothetical protein